MRRPAGKGGLSLLPFARSVFGFLEALENYFFEPAYTRRARGLVTLVQALSVAHRHPSCAGRGC